MTTSPSQQKESADESAMSDLANMKKLMTETKVGADGKTSLWKTTMETFGMADGKTHKSDIVVETVVQGLVLLHAYVDQKDKEYPRKLQDIVPLTEFNNATMDRFLTAFLKWAEKDSNDDKKKKVSGTTSSATINVSRAHRRLDSYWKWMEENRKDLEEPLTVESIHKAAKLWDIQVSYDEKNRFLWWIDLGALDRKKLVDMAPRDHLRYVVWFCHLVLLDDRAQTNGAVIIEDMGHMGFWKMATLVPHDLGAKMDRLTIGVLPVKMKAIYVFGAASWMTIMMTLMKPFMGKKMRERMILVPHKTDMQTFCDDLAGRENIPVGFCGIKGSAPKDAIFEQFHG